MSESPNGFVRPAAKAGALAVPVFRKKTDTPALFPTSASASPSASMSASVGTERKPTFVMPKGRTPP